MYERKVIQKAIEIGWKVAKNGWPDLLLYDEKTKSALFVEVKSAGDKLSRNQINMHKVLNDILGIKVKIVYNNGGYCSVLPKP